MTDVLVLNAAYQPVSIICWEDAITKLYSTNANDRVEIVQAYEDKSVRSAHANHVMPSVVRYVKFHKMKSKGIRFSRDNIWARDRGRCQYCNQQVSRSDFEFEHVIPRSRGGKTTWDNIVTACTPCNARKSNMTPQEAGMRLRSVPMKPDYLPDEFRTNLCYKKWMPKEWILWFKNTYWHGGTEESDD